MENITFNLSEMHRFGGAFFEFLALRKQFFVDNLGWDIPHDESYEMDQYDNPKASYSLVLKDGKVVGGARVMPTTAQWGTHSYMLRDALKGKLIDIPPEVMNEDIVDNDLWECTRLVIDDSIRTHAERSTCLSLIVDGLIETAAENGASRLMSLSPLALMRALRQLGYDADRIGEPYLNEGDGRRYAVLSMSAGRRTAFVPRATHIPAQQPLHAPSKV
jgi:acyl homoserine lactone synthase